MRKVSNDSKKGIDEAKIKTDVNPMDTLTGIFRSPDYSELPKTDHRVIGRTLDLYSFHGVSPGMVYWHKNGLIIRDTLMAFIREELEERGYMEISTPVIASTNLWKVSGHWDHYKGDMFLTAMRDGGEFGLKPMNCPSTFLVFGSKQWSYRDFPVRIADFDILFRNELSGVASGLFRVKSFTQDDAHVFMREDQIKDEIHGQLDLLKKLYGVFNLPFKLKISTMPDGHIGEKDQWDNAIEILVDAVKQNGLDYEIKPKEGAFYGPKIDVDVKDSAGREWQCATFQLDFQMPGRFGLSYAGEDGKEHVPVVLHRVIYGSIERFIGILTEHYQGKFPTWIAPVQVVVAPLSSKYLEYSNAIRRTLKKEGVRIKVDDSNTTLGYKIRDARNKCIPYTVIVGGNEEMAGTISIRTRTGFEKKDLSLKEFTNTLLDEISSKKNDLSYS